MKAAPRSPSGALSGERIKRLALPEGPAPRGGRPLNRLTAREVQTLRRPGRHADGGGLYLHVDPPAADGAPGAKRWVFVFQWRRKRKEMGLGPVDLSPGSDTLRRAREDRNAARRHLDAGRNPIDERRTAAEAAREVPTFGAYAKDVVAGLHLKNAKHRDQWERTLTDYAPRLQGLAVDAVGVQDVLEALKPHWTRIPETAERMRGRIERVLDAARAAGYIAGPWENPARWKGHLSLLLGRVKRPVRHHPALPHGEIAAFMARLRRRRGVSAAALRFAILTAARTQEVRFARWPEVDFAAALWNVPPDRMKMGRAHRVPLSAEVIAELEAILPPGETRETAAKLDAYIFPGRGKGAPLSNMSMDRVLRLEAADVTVHGFRSTFKDWAEDCTNFPNGVIEAALAHLVGDETERAYRRGDALDKRRKLMDAWAGVCSRPAGGQVRPFARPA